MCLPLSLDRSLERHDSVVALRVCIYQLHSDRYRNHARSRAPHGDMLVAGLVLGWSWIIALWICSLVFCRDTRPVHEHVEGMRRLEPDPSIYDHLMAADDWEQQQAEHDDDDDFDDEQLEDQGAVADDDTSNDSSSNDELSDNDGDDSSSADSNYQDDDDDDGDGD